MSPHFSSMLRILPLGRCCSATAAGRSLTALHSSVLRYSFQMEMRRLVAEPLSAGALSLIHI
eukprot:15252502-Alexandrium_andersonii.AAC.1